MSGSGTPFLQAFPLIAILLAAGAGDARAAAQAGPDATGDRQATRYGEAVAKPGTAGQFDLFLDGRLLGSVRAPEGQEATDASLYLVTAAGPADYVLVDLGETGLHCRHEFFVIALAPGRAPRLSGRFGECHELAGAEYLADGIVVSLVESGDEAGSDGVGSTPRISRFRWRDGRVTEQPADVPYRQSP